MSSIPLPTPGAPAHAGAVRDARAAWRIALGALAVLLPALIALYLDTAREMVGVWWRSETFAHAWLVPPIVAWLIWRERARLAALTPSASAGALAAMVALGAVWLLGDVAAVNAAAQFALVGLLVLAVVAVLGTRVAREIAFPLAFLFFAVPFGEFMVPQLMQWTADFAAVSVRASGVPVYREGMQLLLPTGAWSVVDACSGIRYMIASIMVGSLFAYLNYRTLRRRLLFIGVSIVVPVLANWVRAYMIIMLGHLSNNELAAGVDHLIYGWVFFGVVMVLMFAVGARWSEPEGAAVAPAAATPAATPSATRGRIAVVAAVSLALLAVPPLAGRWLQTDDLRAPPVLAAPAVTSAWTLTWGEIARWQPVYQAPDAHAQWIATDGAGHRVGLYIAYYADERPGHKLVSSNNMLVRNDDSAWRLVQSSTSVVDGGSEGAVAMQNAQIAPTVGITGTGGTRLVAWRVYWVDGRWIVSDTAAKVYGAVRKILNRRGDAAVVVFHATAEDAEALPAFVGQNLAKVRQQLENVRSTTGTTPAAPLEKSQ